MVFESCLMTLFAAGSSARGCFLDVPAEVVDLLPSSSFIGDDRLDDASGMPEESADESG